MTAPFRTFVMASVSPASLAPFHILQVEVYSFLWIIMLISFHFLAINMMVISETRYSLNQIISHDSIEVQILNEVVECLYFFGCFNAIVS